MWMILRSNAWCPFLLSYMFICRKTVEEDDTLKLKMDLLVSKVYTQKLKMNIFLWQFFSQITTTAKNRTIVSFPPHLWSCIVVDILKIVWNEMANFIASIFFILKIWNLNSPYLLSKGYMLFILLLMINNCKCFDLVIFQNVITQWWSMPAFFNHLVFPHRFYIQLLDSFRSASIQQ